MILKSVFCIFNFQKISYLYFHWHSTKAHVAKQRISAHFIRQCGFPYTLPYQIILIIAIGFIIVVGYDASQKKSLL
jgi:hypothetical protein